MAAELSQYFGFLTIFKESFKLIFKDSFILILKNVKLMAAITLVSLLLSSTLLPAFIYTYIFLTNFTQTKHSAYLPFIHLLIFMLGIFSFAKISKLTGIATVLVSATSYSDTVMSCQDLWSRVKTSSNSSKAFGYRTSSQRGLAKLATIVLLVFIFLAIFHHNPITITIAVVLGVLVFTFSLYNSIPKALSSVVSVVEEKYEGSEALERAQELIEGQRHHGFMISFFINTPFMIALVAVWSVLGDKLWSVNAVWIWLIFVNFSILAIMYGVVAYTVLYFRCKMYHGDHEDQVGNFGYSVLPAGASKLDAGDIH